MLNVRRIPASRNHVASPVLCPPEREDEPDLRELVRDALVTAGFRVIVDFRTENVAGSIRVSFTAPVPSDAWECLGGFDVASDGDRALRVSYAGSFAADGAETDGADHCLCMVAA